MQQEHTNNSFGFPLLGFGLGLRHPHHPHVLERRPRLGWFEVISENFMDCHEGHREMLADLRRDYPITLHGVSLSVGSPDPINREYLAELKRLIDFIDPVWVSDHVCWTGVHGINTHDLMPVPYTELALKHFIHRVCEVQDVLGRPLVLENPSSYLSFQASTMPESEFLARLAEGADCGILLDVNNVYVSAFNHRFDAHAYIDAMPANRVVQIHLAGHDNKGTHIVDTHDSAVTPPVWDLYAYTLQRMGMKNTLIEWDEHIPDFEVLYEEMQKARNYAYQTLEEKTA